MSEREGNNFDFLRLGAALLVILSHSFSLTGVWDDPLAGLTGSMSFGTLAVVVFFVISGYLIAKSWDARPSAARFLWSRFLRIVPGLAGAVLFSLLIVGPLVTTLPLNEYFSSPMTWAYLKNIGVFWINYDLPGAFSGNPLPGVVNGSLWTLPREVNMYLVVLAIGALGLLKNKNFLLAITASAVAIYAYDTQPALAFARILFGLLDTIGFTPGLAALTNYFAIFFMMGALFYVFRGRLRFDGGLAALLLLLWALSFRSGFFDLASFACLPYVVLYLAFVPAGPPGNAAKHGDFSYGLYIYAFPVQQSIAYFLRGVTALEMFALAVPLALALAFLSWHLVESRALRLKGLDARTVWRYFRLLRVKA